MSHHKAQDGHTGDPETDNQNAQEMIRRESQERGDHIGHMDKMVSPNTGIEAIPTIEQPYRELKITAVGTGIEGSNEDKKTMNYKGTKASKVSKHQFLRKNFGRPSYCSNTLCEKKSKVYEWCKKRGRRYTHNPDDYLWLCRSCHRKYDLTPKKKRQAIKNLEWSKGSSRTKLSFKKAQEIREAIKSGITMYRLAKNYKVDKRTIANIRDNQIWKDSRLQSLITKDK